MISIHNLKISAGDTALVNHSSFEIARGESLGIIGESGSGKSLTALALMGLLNPRQYKVEGEIFFNGEALLNKTEKERAALRLSEMGMIYQNPFNTFSPVQKIGRQFRQIYQFKKRRCETELWHKRLKEMGLTPAHLEKYPHELSGGELQRLVILLSVLFDPALLICDEPTTSLDRETGERIITMLNRIRQERGLSLLFITHDLSLIDTVTDRLLIMKKGEIIERGKTEKILTEPENIYTRYLLECSILEREKC